MESHHRIIHYDHGEQENFRMDKVVWRISRGINTNIASPISHIMSETPQAMKSILEVLRTKPVLHHQCK